MISLGIFAKPPRPGLVKTRLIPDIGADKAARVYRYCLEYTLEVARESGLEFQLYLSEVCDDELLQDEEHFVQKGTDLGTRMFNAIKEMLTTSTDGAIIIGSDCLDISSKLLLQAARALAGLGMSEAIPDLQAVVDEDPNEFVRAAAAHAVKVLGTE